MKKITILLRIAFIVGGLVPCSFSAELSDLKNRDSFQSQVLNLRGQTKETAQRLTNFVLDKATGQQHTQTYLCGDKETGFFFEKGPPLTFLVNYKRGSKDTSYVLLKRANLEVFLGGIMPGDWKIRGNRSIKNELPKDFSFIKTFRNMWCKGLYGNNSYDDLPEEFRAVVDQESKPLMQAVIGARAQLKLSEAVRNSTHEYYVWSYKDDSNVGVRCIFQEKVGVDILTDPQLMGKKEEDEKENGTESPSKSAMKEVASPSRNDEDMSAQDKDAVPVTQIITYYKSVVRTDDAGRRKSKEEVLQELRDLTQYCSGLTEEVINSLANLQIVLDKGR